MPSNNLPLLLTSFIGRENEIAEVGSLLQHTHLLTLTGAGGSGKTRLALAAASGLLDRYPDGVWLIELASLSDPSLLHQATASTLGVHETPGTSLARTLTEYLRSRQLLLVLDNCEHLIDDCARLVFDLLSTCPGVQILATSREPLHIAGEVTWLVPPLALPNLERLPRLSELKTIAAVRLFIERARSVAPAFDIHEENAHSIAQICCWLGGIPLAIELAAARVRLLAPQEIARRLDDAFHLLTSHERFVPSRHQTLQATMDWSHNLLPEAEQTLFRRLAAFAGGFSLEAAETVCASPAGQNQENRIGVITPPADIRQQDVLDLLAQLIEKSLVLVEQETGLGLRYRLLEPVRQYGMIKLQDSGEEDRIRDLHLQWYLGLAEKAAPELARAQRKRWVERLEQDTPNLRAAFDWSAARPGRANLGARLASALSQFWQTRGYFSEGLERLETVLSRSTEISGAERASALQSAAFLAVHVRDTRRAKTYLDEALDLARAAGDRSGTAQQQHLLGWAAMQEGDLERAEGAGIESLAIYQELEDRTGAAMALMLLGDLAYLRGDIDRASAHQEEGLAMSQQNGYALGIPRRLTRLAQIAQIRGQSQRARSFFEESLRLCREGGDHWGMAMALAGLAGLVKASGDPKHAARLLGATQAFLNAFGTPLWPLDQKEFDECSATVRAQIGETAFEVAWQDGLAFEMRDLDRLVEFALSETEPSRSESSQAERGLRRTSLQAAKHEFSGLTRREREVAALIAQGKGNLEIAASLYIGLRTVEAHVTHILDKLGFNSRTQVAGWAVDKGLANPPQAPTELKNPKT